MVVFHNELDEIAADSEVVFAVKEAVAMQADFAKVVFHNEPDELAVDSEVAFAVKEAVHIVMDETAAGLNMASVATEADFEKVVFQNESDEMIADSDSDIASVAVPVAHIESVATAVGCFLLEAARIVTEIVDFDIEHSVLVVLEKPAATAHTEAAGDIALAVVAAALVGVVVVAAADDEMALQAKGAKVL